MMFERTAAIMQQNKKKKEWLKKKKNICCLMHYCLSPQLRKFLKSNQYFWMIQAGHTPTTSDVLV